MRNRRWVLALEAMKIATHPVAPEPSKLGFKDPDNGEWNSQVIINGHIYRERAEVLILKGDMVWAQRYNDGRYIIPGGGTSPNLSMEQTAIRESQEEIQITPDDLRYYGYYTDRVWYEWDRKRGYYGSISHYFVGTFLRDYDKKVAEQDKEPEMVREGKFWPLDEAEGFLRLEHWEAIQSYLEFVKKIRR